MPQLCQSDLQRLEPIEDLPSTSDGHRELSMQEPPLCVALKSLRLFFLAPIRFFHEQVRICFVGLSSVVWNRSTFERHRWPDQEFQLVQATQAEEPRSLR